MNLRDFAVCSIPHQRLEILMSKLERKGLWFSTSSCVLPQHSYYFNDLSRLCTIVIWNGGFTRKIFMVFAHMFFGCCILHVFQTERQDSVYFKSWISYTCLHFHRWIDKLSCDKELRNSYIIYKFSWCTYKFGREHNIFRPLFSREMRQINKRRHSAAPACNSAQKNALKYIQVATDCLINDTRI